MSVVPLPFYYGQLQRDGAGCSKSELRTFAGPKPGFTPHSVQPCLQIPESVLYLISHMLRTATNVLVCDFNMLQVVRRTVKDPEVLFLLHNVSNQN